MFEDTLDDADALDKTCTEVDEKVNEEAPKSEFIVPKQPVVKQLDQSMANNDSMVSISSTRADLGDADDVGDATVNEEFDSSVVNNNNKSIMTNKPTIEIKSDQLATGVPPVNVKPVQVIAPASKPNTVDVPAKPVENKAVKPAKSKAVAAPPNVCPQPTNLEKPIGNFFNYINSCSSKLDLNCRCQYSRTYR